MMKATSAEAVKASVINILKRDLYGVRKQTASR